ncbi:MAG: recombinase family protein, partial [Lachnospiraceae bacterium]|nr:recombinase family protein [Lachnospiraceae bacterium]
HKEAQGKVISGRMAPYGYKVVDGYVEKDETVSHIVEDAFDRYFKTFSIRDVIRYVNLKYGEDAPSNNIVDRLFKNEKYCGRFKDNPNWCEPYITREQYEQIRLIGTAKQNTAHYEPYLFTSLIKCPVCGNNFTGYRKKQKLKNGGESIYIKYRCGNKFNRHGGASILEKTVEKYLIENVLIYLQRDIRNLKSIMENEQINSKCNLKGIEDEMNRLNVMYQKGRITDTFYDSQYELLERKLAELSSLRDIKQTIDKRENLLSFFQGNWIDLYNSLDAANKKVFWKKYIKDIQVDRETRKLCGFHFY